MSHRFKCSMCTSTTLVRLVWGDEVVCPACYALGPSVSDPTRPGHEMVTVQVGSYAAAQAHGEIMRDLIYGGRS